MREPSEMIEQGDFESSKEAAEQKDALVALIKSRGWSIVCDVVLRGINSRTDQVMLVPTGETLSAFAQEYMKGEVNAFRTIQHLPTALIEMCEAYIDQNEEED